LLHEGDLSGGTVRDALTAPFPITWKHEIQFVHLNSPEHNMDSY
jgi:hypothetical protein